MAIEREGRLHRWFSRVLARPGWVLTLAAIWGLAGVLAFAGLRRDLFPDVGLPSLSLMVQSPGRAAPELELSVAQPLEQAIGGLPGVKRVVSTVQREVVQVVVAFGAGTDPWRARQLVGERLASVVASFPEGTRAPLVTSAAGRLLEVQEIVLEGPRVDPMRLRDHTEKVLVPRLQAVPGVARVERLGGQERQLQVVVPPEKMRLLEASLDAVVEALEGSDREGPAFRRGLTRHVGHGDVSLRVIKQPGADTLHVTADVRETLEELRRGLPEGMALTLMYDQGALVSHALGGVTTALLIGAALVATVLVLLLGHLRSAFVVVAVLPLATLGAALPLSAAGLGLNAMTLGGLAIAVGLLVDAAVIMVENLVHRLREAEQPRRETLSRAAAEVGLPILTAVAVILAVFIPLLSVGGIAGRLYAPLALAVASAMTISLALAFTHVPVLVDRVVPPMARLDEPRIVTAVKRAYAPALDWALCHGLVVRAIALGLTVPAVLLALSLGTNFLPSLDEGAVMLQSWLPAETSLAAVDEANVLLEAKLKDLHGIAGGLLALWLAGETWNIRSVVGVIGLFGVAVQNSLVLIAQAKELMGRGLPFEAALREASLGRVRPKLMTAGAAILGLTPMLVGIGGSELERPLAVVMVGGLVTSTLFTLLALPSFYAWVARPRARAGS